MAKRKSKVQPYTPEQIDKSLDNERIRLILFAIMAVFGGLAVFVLALTPLASAIAGTNTNFNVNVSLAFNVALAATTVAGGGGCYELNRRRRHHQVRARELEGRLKALKTK